MCIIIVKNRGVGVPTETALNNCFMSNSDGAGIMYVRGGEGVVHIDKGYMNYASFLSAVDNHNFSENDVVVYHFRLATHGIVNRRQTHPFPITREKRYLFSLRYQTDMGVAHNGILKVRESRKMSDTIVYIRDHLAHIKPYIFKSNHGIQRLVELSSEGSKLAFLKQDGDTWLTGTWVEENGLLYSNTSYERGGYFSFRKKSTMATYGYGWETYRDDDDTKGGDHVYEDMAECPNCGEQSYDTLYYDCYSCGYRGVGNDVYDYEDI